MYEATLHLQLEGDCVLSELASETDDTIDIEVLELHDELVTLIVQAEGHESITRHFLKQSKSSMSNYSEVKLSW
ncbi:hypothetical protein ACFFQF_16075 [Haladaptatus pallidirubidus]|uniref:hypothetical protein n=1 Tax=Haladaptatus pallidirubidus TaxID=1008152 RepID=UPI0035E50A0F